MFKCLHCSKMSEARRDSTVVSQISPIILLCREPEPIGAEDRLKIDKYCSKAERGLLEISPIFVPSK